MKDKNRYYIKRSENKELIKKLHDEIFPDDIWCGLEHTVSWVVWFNKKPVGFCLLNISDSDYGYYTRAGINKKHWGKGLHKRMLLVREKFARQFGYSRIVTYTTIDNIQSISNLQKRGYMIYEPKSKYADDKKNKFLYWKKDL
jgi:RimJ/RimL family protein N-acetyltransferase